jgi:hypothetical protein
MTKLEYTTHARTRMQQRAFSEWDCDFIFRHGTALGDDGVILLDQDVDREIGSREAAIRRLKSEIERIGKLRGARVVQAGNQVVTCYNCSPRVMRHWLRKDRLCA